MSIQQAYEHIQQAEKLLSELVSEQQKQATGETVLYLFVYEQRFKKDEQIVDGIPTVIYEWKPNYQEIEASSISIAFAGLGMHIERMRLTLRNINYGLVDSPKMQGEMKRVDDFYDRENKASEW